MRKKHWIILIIVYLVTFIPGTLLQVQKGVMLHDQLWRQTEANHFELSQDSYLTLNGDAFQLSMNNRLYTGHRNQSSDNEIVFSFDDGWSLIYPLDPYQLNISFSAGRYHSGGNGRIRIDDLDTMNLRFMEVGKTERNPIMNTNGDTVGESVHVLGVDGETTLAYSEIWFDQSEFSSPRHEVRPISNGSEFDVYDTDLYILTNEAGEYLLNQDELFYLNLNGSYLSKGIICAFIERAMNQQIVQRGSLWFAVLSTILYWFGACSFLYARQFALWGERWKYDTEVEPSEAYLFTQKAGGIVLMCIAILLLFLKFN